jgi:hypothetical protein
MVGTGRTNHAGGGDPAVLAAVKAETVPYDRELKPSKGNLNGVDGNAPFYGLEVMYSGARDVPKVGYVAMVRWNTAICRHHGWSGASAIAHREWSSDKPDPGRVNLPQLRRDIDAALALPPGVWGTTTTPPPKPQPEPTRIEPAMRIIRSKDTGACYEVGPNLCQHIPTIERLRALEKTWGPLVDMTQVEVQLVWDQTVDDINATKSNFGLPLVPPAEPPVADRSLGGAIDDAAPDCAEPSRHNV